MLLIFNKNIYKVNLISVYCFKKLQWENKPYHLVQETIIPAYFLDFSFN